MGIGDLYTVETGDCTDLHYIDTGMYDTEEYGSVYILDTKRPAVIDTGTGLRYDAILDAMETVGIARDDLAYIAPTHVHLDHAGGAGYLARECPNAEVVTHERGARHLIDPSRIIEGTKVVVRDQWEFYREPVPVPDDRLRELTDGDAIDLGDRQLITHYAPGHAPHQVVFEDPANDAVFTADAAGIYVPAIDVIRETTPPTDFDLEQCLVDIEMIQDIDPETLLYGHYGPAPTDERLDEYADVLSEWVDEVREARQQYETGEAVIEYFAGETSMDDVWSERKARAEAALNTRGVLRYLDSQEK
jgi:glyoxylase-like metal-dependent hydrolase (beta-lactamase superfamily II)